MCRWISTLLAAVMMANLAVWPAGALAEVLEHEHELIQSDAQIPPNEPSPERCLHGCAGHYAQHFHWQVPVSQIDSCAAISTSVVTAPEKFSPQHIPALPVRPPLSALILS